MSPLGFKASIGSFIYTWQRCMCYMFPEIHLWCNTCQPLSGQHGSWANLLHIPATRHWWDLDGRPIAPQANALPTELCWLALDQNIFITSFMGSYTYWHEDTLSSAYNKLFDAKKSARYSQVIVATKLIVAGVLLIVQCSYQGTILSHLMSTNH